MLNAEYILQDLLSDPIEVTLKQRNLDLVFEELYRKTYLIVVEDLIIPFEIPKGISLVKISTLEQIPCSIQSLSLKGTIFVITKGSYNNK